MNYSLHFEQQGQVNWSHMSFKCDWFWNSVQLLLSREPFKGVVWSFRFQSVEAVEEGDSAIYSMKQSCMVFFWL